MENRKIINATPTKVDDIQFKSRLEASIYKAMKDRGLQPQYEPDTFIIYTGFKPTNSFIDGKHCKRKLLDVTYTPDFKVEYKNLTVYIEVKGYENDVYPYKKKLFLNRIQNSPDIIFFEVHSKRGLVSCLDKLEELYGKDIPSGKNEGAGS